jgi:hypothetical protein
MITNKKGQGLSTNAIILIVLGVVVLVALIAGFVLGWQNFAPFLQTNNVNTIVKSCATACSSDSKYDFCTLERELKDGEGKKFTETCNVFSKSPYTQYGVGECSRITCTTETVYKDEATAILNCIRVGETLKYEGGTQPHACLEKELATTESKAIDRCKGKTADTIVNYLENGKTSKTHKCTLEQIKA